MMLTKGYSWLPERRRRSADGVVETRVLGRPAFGIGGAAAARFFYDERQVRRPGAAPLPRVLFTADRVHDLVGETAATWDATAPRWAGRSVSLLDESAAVLADGVARWMGLPRDGDLAGDCVAMVEGSADAAGPRRWRARAARRRQERRLTDVVATVRDGRPQAPGSATALEVVARHRAGDGHLVSRETAAVELLDIARPAIAVCWLVAFAAHALHRWPEHRDALRSGDPGFARAFAHEVRRLYPGAPFVAGRAAGAVEFAGHAIPDGAVVLLDLHGPNHDPAVWKNPYRFDPGRFLGPDALDPADVVPPAADEPATVALLSDLAVRVARLDYEVPPQDLDIPLDRAPTRPRSGMLVRPR
ncbi:fatty-acid peroxygenase [Asanoa hainanensis]|uniref:Fatty-acid peroxygenase n=1 Tax=Asanoa hainanensis TaxID=560556 RepID=A0A239PC08_9ACTN|nr:cytochrome P450 [Asanoa hainanensis]SNT64098.1 fatty-acid peroxygenase [Asanoa hainanensis]